LKGPLISISFIFLKRGVKLFLTTQDIKVSK
jgi:hypothetical protein